MRPQLHMPPLCGCRSCRGCSPNSRRPSSDRPLQSLLAILVAQTTAVPALQSRVRSPARDREGAIIRVATLANAAKPYSHDTPRCRSLKCLSMAVRCRPRLLGIHTQDDHPTLPATHQGYRLPSWDSSSSQILDPTVAKSRAQRSLHLPAELLGSCAALLSPEPEGMPQHSDAPRSLASQPNRTRLLAAHNCRLPATSPATSPTPAVEAVAI